MSSLADAEAARDYKALTNHMVPVIASAQKLHSHQASLPFYA